MKNGLRLEKLSNTQHVKHGILTARPLALLCGIYKCYAAPTKRQQVRSFPLLLYNRAHTSAEFEAKSDKTVTMSGEIVYGEIKKHLNPLMMTGKSTIKINICSGSAAAKP